MAILLAASPAIDLYGVTRRPPNVRVATGLDAARFWDLIVAAVAALG
jgi:inosine-uridine nucleoside N-ribohydrolase